MTAKTAKTELDTRQRLLEAAREVFARKGYRDATIAEISERAGANIAAVNYYFRDKEKLYVEAWRIALQRSLEAHPPDGGVSPQAPVRERLRGRILAVLQRLADSSNGEFEIVHKELANPTGLLEQVMRESIEPLRRELEAIVRDLLGPGASELQVQMCRMSIMAQCLHPIMRRRRLAALGAVRPDVQVPDFDVEAFADHIARFSLAGIDDLRRQNQSGDVPNHP